MRKTLGAALCGGALCLSPLAAQVPVRGRVLDAGGGPLAGARVEATAFLPGYEAGVRRLAGLGLEPVAIANSDGGGRYAVELPGAGVWQVTVRAPSRLPMELGPLALVDETTLPVVRLEAADELVVTVLSLDDRPLPGVAVVARRSSRARESGWRQAFRFDSTDEAGSVRLPRGRGEEVELSVFAPEGAERVHRVTEKEPVRLSLEPPATTCEARLRVVDQVESAGLADVLVRVGELAWPVGLTGAEGSLAVATDCGRQPVLLLTPDGRQLRTWIPPGGLPDGATLKMPPRESIRERVTDPSDRPVSGALVWAGADPGGFVFTDAAGTYQLHAPTAARFWVQAEAVGYLPSRDWVPAGPGRVAGPRLRVGAQTEACGVVLGAGRQPLAGVEVSVSALRGDADRGFHRTDPADGRSSSDAAGRFRVGGLRAGTAYRLRAERPGFLAASVEFAAGDDRRPAGELRLVLERSRPIVGRVTDRGGRPIAEATVTATSLDPGGEEALPAGQSDAAPLGARTGADGRFRLERQPAARFELGVEREGFAAARRRFVSVAAGAGPIDAGDVVLVLSSTLRGRVVDGVGRPVLGAEIHLDRAEAGPAARSSRPRRPAALSDDRGRFLLDGLVAGEQVTLVVEAAGCLARSLRGVPVGGDDEVTVALRRTAALAGRVVDGEERPVAGARVAVAWPNYLPDYGTQFRLGDRAREVTRTDAGGSFEVAGEPGAAEIRVEAAGFVVPEPVTVEVGGAGPGEEIWIVLERGAVLAGRVTTLDGEPLSPVRVSVGGAAGFSDGEGRYRLEGVAPGAWLAVAWHGDLDPLTEELQIEAGVNRHDWIFPPGARVAGHVRNEHGERVVGAKVTLARRSEAAPREYRTLSDLDGGFAFPRVAAGRYELETSRRGYAPSPVVGPIDVGDRALEGLELVLPPGARVVGRIEGLEPWQWAAVVVEAESSGRTATGLVDHAGGYEIADLAPGPWQLTASLEGGRRVARAVAVIETDRRVAEQDLVFGGGLALSGLALYDDWPLEGALVSVREAQSGDERSVTTGFDGRFELRDLAPGAYRLGLVHPAEALIHAETLRLVADREVRIELAPASVEGLVLDSEEARPLANALVNLVRDEGSGAAAGSVATTTGADGSFALPRVPPANYRLAVSKDGYAPRELRLDVGAGVQIGGLEVRLDPTDGLWLVVRTDRGRTPSHVEIRAFDAAGRPVVARARAVGPQGEVHLADLPPGRLRLLVGAAEAALTEIEAVVPGSPVGVILREGSPLLVRVPELLTSELVGELTLVGGDGIPLRHLEPGGPVRDRWPLVRGLAGLAGVPAGTWTATAVASDGRVWQAPVTTDGRGPQVLDLR